MKSQAYSILTIGSAAITIEIECQLSNGLPSIIIVGLGNKAVDEAKERIRSAFASTGLKLPRKRITINLAPADIPKVSSGFDLAIVAAILAASGQSKTQLDKTQAIIGEVGLTGVVRPVRGIIGKLVAAKTLGITNFFIPADNMQQALLVPDIRLIPIKDIKDFCLVLSKEKDLGYYDSNARERTVSPLAHNVHSMSAIAGQLRAKRALEIAAAGGHNILLFGPPGTGKTMLAKALPSLLPPLSHEEILEVTHLHSLASNTYDQLITQRPFRAPHHSASHISIVGGGSQATPGEITLSHRGILFLDEMPEFNRPTLEALRQPLEDHRITITRAKYTAAFPAHFILIATANPCPCGFYGSKKPCRCTPSQLMRYQQKISGPILDRIDLHVTMDTVEHRQLLSSTSTSAHDDQVPARVLAARSIQAERFHQGHKLNTDMNNVEIKKYSHLDASASSLLNTAAQRLDMSARGYMRIIKVARTIADLEKSSIISTEHIAEALQYRDTQSLEQ